LAEKTLVLKNFKGINNVLPKEKLTVITQTGPYSYLQRACNLDIDNDYRIVRRPGFSSLAAGAAHSLWSDGKDLCLFRQSDGLYRLLPDRSAKLLRSGIVGNNRMVYCAVAGRVYYSDGAITGCVEDGVDRSWGIAPPSLDLISITAGDLKAGTYILCYTYERSDGQESGSSNFAFVKTDGTQGIVLYLNPSRDMTIAWVNIYASTTDGMVLYRMGRVPNDPSLASFIISSLAMIREGSLPLLTEGCDRAPAGSVLEYHNGQLYVAQGPIVWRSRPYAPELFDLAHDYQLYPDMVEVMGAVTDGMYVGTSSQCVFQGGTDPEKFTNAIVADCGAIRGSLKHIDLAYFADGSKGDAVMFATKKGICVGKPGGEFQNLTAETYAMGELPLDLAAMVRNRDGQVHYVMAGSMAALARGSARLPQVVAEGNFLAATEGAIILPALDGAGT
jgi:hypothetical protein